jgi:hypothetical protein
VLLVLAVGLARLFEPRTSALAQAVHDLGPISGWRCAQSGGTYVYDPRRDRPDRGLLAEPPEDMLGLAAPQVTVERVEANLRGGDTVVWSRVGPEDQGGERRVYVLSPGRMQAITFEFENAQATVCDAHLGSWRIVAEHALG